jgi:hypothetical protein
MTMKTFIYRGYSHQFAYGLKATEFSLVLVYSHLGKCLALVSLTSGGRSVGIVRLRTTSHGVVELSS